MHAASDRDDLVSVSALNQYHYCPRRYWYYRFYDAGDRSPDLVEGQSLHDGQTRQSGQFREQYFAAPSVGLHGTVDLIDTDGPDDDGDTGGDAIVPVERKRASGGRYYWNDEVQLAGYCLLVGAATDVDGVDRGVIYLYETDERHAIEITDEHRQAVTDTVAAIRSLTADDPPGLVDNPNKCTACSVRHECLPAVTSRVDPDVAADSRWSEVSPHE